ncbi:uncharacterized protein ACWYII_004537 [Salvelinus alpinus]
MNQVHGMDIDKKIIQGLSEVERRGRGEDIILLFRQSLKDNTEEDWRPQQRFCSCHTSSMRTRVAFMSVTRFHRSSLLYCTSAEIHFTMRVKSRWSLMGRTSTPSRTFQWDLGLC